MSTFFVAGGIFAIFGSHRRSDMGFDGMVRILAARVASSFGSAAEVRALAETIHRETELHVEVRDRTGHVIASTGARRCVYAERAPIVRDGVVVGEMRLCFGPRHGPWVFLLAVFAVCGTLWAMSFWAARRIARPLEALETAARELGEGKLDRRVGRIHGRHDHEIASLASAFDEMASRIERLVRTQRDLLATVSHEIRSPLARLRVLTELVAETSDARPHAPQMAQEIAAMDALVGDLLASVRLDAGAIVRSRVDLYETITRTCVTLGVEADVDVCPEARVVEGDATLLTRAISILIDNARVHGAPPIAIAVAREGTIVSIAVEDSGPGVAADAYARVFEPFVRGEGATEKPGVGLGLSLVKRIAEAHGGRARVEAGRALPGARFVFSLG